MVRPAAADLAVIETSTPDLTVMVGAEADVSVQTVTDTREADVSVAYTTDAYAADLTVASVGFQSNYTAGPVENGAAPLLVAALGPVTAYPGTTPDAAGWTEASPSLPATVLYAWRYPVVSPQVGASLVGWGIESTNLDSDPGGSTDGTHISQLADSTPTWPAGTETPTGDMDELSAHGPPGSVGGWISWSGAVADKTGTVEVTLDTPVVDPVGWHIEQALLVGNTPNMDTVLFGRVYTLWSL